MGPTSFLTFGKDKRERRNKINNVTHAKELSLDKDLRDDDAVAIHPLLELLLHLSVHGNVSLLVIDEQRAQNALHLQTALECLPHHAHRRRVHHHFAVLPFRITLQKINKYEMVFRLFSPSDACKGGGEERR